MEPTTYNTVLMDADVICFRACAVSETSVYTVWINGEESIAFRTKREAEEHIKTMTEAEIVKHKEYLPLPVVYKIIDNIIHEICNTLDCYEYTLFIGQAESTPTFRHNIAKTALYKGNRKAEDKPKYLDQAKQYVVDKYNAIRAVNCEADDLLGIAQCEPGSNSIIASIDKDLLMIPGWHYNIMSKEILYATEFGELNLLETNGKKKLKGTGYCWWIAQLLMGDAVDNIIKPVKGLGDVGIYNLLSEYTTKEDMWNCVKDIYEKANRDISENAALLYIQRKPGQSYMEILT